MPLAEIAALSGGCQAAGRKPQQVLADELTELVHGKGALAAVRRISELLFSGDDPPGERSAPGAGWPALQSHRGGEDSSTLVVESGLANSGASPGSCWRRGHQRQRRDPPDEQLTADDRCSAATCTAAPGARSGISWWRGRD